MCIRHLYAFFISLLGRVIGRVAATGKHQWISGHRLVNSVCSIDEVRNNFDISNIVLYHKIMSLMFYVNFQHFDKWKTQFTAGIRVCHVLSKHYSINFVGKSVTGQYNSINTKNYSYWPVWPTHFAILIQLMRWYVFWCLNAIQTIAVVAVGSYGVVQLGSLKTVRQFQVFTSTVWIYL